ncbi:hypothetical protein D3C84_746840 [compost metagenome]
MRRQVGEQPRPGHGRQPGQQRNDAPEAEHQPAAAPFLAQPGGTGQALRQVGEEDRHQHQQADLAAIQQPEAQAERFGNAVEEGADCDQQGDHAAAAIATPAAVVPLQAVDVLAGQDEDPTAGQQPRHGRPETAYPFRLGNLPEAQGGDQHAAAIGHDRGHRLLRQPGEKSDGRAQQQAAGGQPAPEAGLDGDGNLHALLLVIAPGSAGLSAAKEGFSGTRKGAHNRIE